MDDKRVFRLNSLLKEVISDIIKKEVRNPHVTELSTITSVSISKDLHHAKVYVSVIGSEEDKRKTIEALQSAAGFIAKKCSKQVTIRYFPDLVFFLDTSAEKHERIEKVLGEIHKEQELREKTEDAE